jgi:hypothetical protein
MHTEKKKLGGLELVLREFTRGAVDPRIVHRLCSHSLAFGHSPMVALTSKVS